MNANVNEELLNRIIPVVLAGGKGTRLWPLTSEKRPKALLKFFSKNSFLQRTLKRVEGFGAPVLVCDATLVEGTLGQTQDMGVRPRKIVAEPMGRGTAGALAIAALSCDDPESVMVSLPCDHAVSDAGAFRYTLAHAAQIAADKGEIVLLGVKPESADTRYGYICGAASTQDGARKVQHFVEKPRPERAQDLIAGMGCFWNTGVFVCKVSVFLEELQKHMPQVYSCAKKAMESAERTDHFILPNEKHYQALPVISVDHAVLEKSDKLSVVGLPCEWSDTGTFLSLLQRFFLKE